MALDRVLARLDKSQIMPKNVEGVKADPPAIFYSTSPAVLVNLDGDPVWSPIKKNDLRFAVNTNWDLFEHKPTQHVLPPRTTTAGSARRDVNGPVESRRQAAGQLQPSCRPTTNWNEVKAALPGRTLASRAAEGVRQHDAGRNDSADGRAELSVRSPARSCCG